MLAAAGLGFAPGVPALARLAHLRAVLAVRLSLEAGDAWQAAGRTGAPSGASSPRCPDGCPPVMSRTRRCPGRTCPAPLTRGERRAVEAELTPKPLARTAAIMSGLLTRTAGYHRIQAGEFTRRLPAERDLARQCGVAYQTLRHGIDLLRTRGLVITGHGRGTFVASPGRSEPPGLCAAADGTATPPGLTRTLRLPAVATSALTQRTVAA